MSGSGAFIIFEVACTVYCCRYRQQQQHTKSYAKTTDFILTRDSSIAITYLKLHLFLVFFVLSAVMLFSCSLLRSGSFYVFTYLCCMCVLLPAAWLVFVLLSQHVNKQLLNWVELLTLLLLLMVLTGTYKKTRNKIC
jgi:hypothetical protein